MSVSGEVRRIKREISKDGLEDLSEMTIEFDDNIYSKVSEISGVLKDIGGMPVLG
jgi:hypothetical protein